MGFSPKPFVEPAVYVPSRASDVTGVCAFYTSMGYKVEVKYLYLNFAEGSVFGSNLGNYDQAYAKVPVIVDQHGNTLWEGNPNPQSRKATQSALMIAEIRRQEAERLQREAVEAAKQRALDEWNAKSEDEKVRIIAENYVSEHGPRPDKVQIGTKRVKMNLGSIYIHGIGSVPYVVSQDIPVFDTSAQDAWDKGYTEATGRIYSTGETVAQFNDRMNELAKSLSKWNGSFGPDNGSIGSTVAHAVTSINKAQSSLVTTVTTLPQIPKDPYGLKGQLNDYNARADMNYAAWAHNYAHMRNPGTGITPVDQSLSAGGDIQITDLEGYYNFGRGGKVRDAHPGSKGQYHPIRANDIISPTVLKDLGFDTSSLPPGAFVIVNRIYYQGANSWSNNRVPVQISGEITFANPLL